MRKPVALAMFALITLVTLVATTAAAAANASTSRNHAGSGYAVAGSAAESDR
ncbi:hypothetical protein [Streptomyces sp. PA5.6]|uniref:hypothetical protein n=1 Tax=Streptomyces sp. PA5.6 TaxID=3035651 RepID=UPI00390463E8